MTMTSPRVTWSETTPPVSSSGPADGGSSSPVGPRWRRVVGGGPTDPAWVRPATWSLLVGTAVLYLWNLSASGNANSFYAAAVQAGSTSWKAWFFGSLDHSNFITVDKPPGSLWVMGLSARIFGYNSWSLLAPQALEGVAAVALLVAAVRRVASPAAALMAGLALALTPAAVLIFRFDNPDALLVLLLVAAAYCTTRALESASTTWLLAAGAAIGFGFLTKSGQALLIVPALGFAYLVAAPTSVRRRIGQLVGALLAMTVAAGWWIAAVSLWPAADRPYIGGSTDNNPLELAFGYNGLGRLFGGSGNTGGGGGGENSGFGGATGLARLFRGEFGLEISWLLPAALIAIGAIAWLTHRAPRTDKTRAALIIWGGWLLTTAATFSYMKGTIHPYYTVALAPAIAALIGIAGQQLWAKRGPAALAMVATMVGVSAVWGAVLLNRNDDSHTTELVTIVAAMVALVGLIAVVMRAPATRRVLTATALTSMLTVAVPVSAWGIDTASSVHSGSIPTAVSSSATFGVGSLGGGSGGSSGSTSALVTALDKTSTRWAAATVGSQEAATLELSSGTAVMAIGGFSGTDNASTLAQFKAYVAAGEVRYFIASTGGAGGGFSSSTDATERPSGTASSGARPTGSAPSGSAFSGSATSGTAPSGFGGAAGRSSGVSSSSASAITSWVESHFAKKTIGGQTVYDLSSPKSSSTSTSTSS